MGTMRLGRLACMIVVSGLSCQDVVFVMPYQDLFPEKLSTYGLDNLHDYYNKYASWSGFKTKYDCMRTAQVPMNTGGTLIEFDDQTGEACIQFDHMLVDVGGAVKPCKFWALSYRGVEDGKVTRKRPTFLVIDNKHTKKYEGLFPVKVRYDDVGTLRAKDTIVLTRPWIDDATGSEYSAGTRFARVQQKDTRDSFGVKFFDGLHGEIAVAMISKAYARPCDEIVSDDERRHLFINLLRTWCTKNNIITPYVWGGGLIMTPFEDRGFSLVDDYFFTHPVTYYVRKEQGLPAGVDCSALVLLAAGIAGIDYFYKTTSTLFKQGNPVDAYDALKEGDIIVWNGHMVVVSAMYGAKESCIECLGYGSGAGKVREVVLKKRFKDISSYQDLWNAYQRKQPLGIFYAHNKIVSKIIPEFKIVSLFGEKNNEKDRKSKM